MHLLFSLFLTVATILLPLTAGVGISTYHYNYYPVANTALYLTNTTFYFLSDGEWDAVNLTTFSNALLQDASQWYEVNLSTSYGQIQLMEQTPLEKKQRKIRASVFFLASNITEADTWYKEQSRDAVLWDGYDWLETVQRFFHLYRIRVVREAEPSKTFCYSWECRLGFVALGLILLCLLLFIYSCIKSRNYKKLRAEEKRKHERGEVVEAWDDDDDDDERKSRRGSVRGAAATTGGITSASRTTTAPVTNARTTRTPPPPAPASAPGSGDRQYPYGRPGAPPPAVSQPQWGTGTGTSSYSYEQGQQYQAPYPEGPPPPARNPTYRH